MTFSNLVNGALRETGLGAKTPRMRGYVERIDHDLSMEPELSSDGAYDEVFDLVFHGNPGSAKGAPASFSFRCRRLRSSPESASWEPLDGEPALDAQLLGLLASGDWETFRVSDYMASQASTEAW